MNQGEERGLGTGLGEEGGGGRQRPPPAVLLFGVGVCVPHEGCPVSPHPLAAARSCCLLLLLLAADGGQCVGAEHPDHLLLLLRALLLHVYVPQHRRHHIQGEAHCHWLPLAGREGGRGVLFL